jgi:cysteine synthase A
MLPDTGERYLSTPLFADIPAEMNDEEWAISRSTPNVRFDVAAAPPTQQPATVAQLATPEAAAFVEKTLDENAVVLFALEWCEFCWAVRRMFAHFGIPYVSVDLDSVALQQDNRGGRIRAALTARTSVATIPQVFVGGELIGGATDTLEAWKQGKLQERLDARGVAYRRGDSTDAFSFLPNWLAKRTS